MSVDTPTAVPDLERLLDSDDERACEAWVASVATLLLGGDYYQCDNPARWVAGGRCEAHGTITALLCDDCRDSAAHGATVCGHGCDRTVTLTWTEPLR